MTRTPSSRTSRLRLLPLEARTVPAAITWMGGSGAAGSNAFHIASNWAGGVVPGASDDAIIPNATYTPQLSTTVALKSLTVNNTASSNNFAVVAGGQLTITNGLTLAANTTFGVTTGSATVNGSVSLSGGTLVANAGGVISIPGVTSLTGPLSLTANDAKSLISLPAVTTLSTGTINFSGMAIGATTGGTIDLSNATSALDPATGGSSGRGFTVTAQGASALVNLAKLTTLTDLTAGGTAVSAVSGGEVRIPLVTTLANVSVTVDGKASVLPTTQLTKFVNATFNARGGATVPLSGITSYTGPVTLQADGTGTVLDLSEAKSLGTDTMDYSGVAVYAFGGSTVNLSNVTSALDPATGGGNGRGFNFTANGAGSVVNLAKLATLNDLTPGNTALAAQSGGTVSVPLVTTLDNVSVTVDGAAGTIPLAQVTGLTHCTVTVSSAATASFSGLTSLTGPLTLNAYYASAVLKFPNVTKLNTDTVDFSGITVSAANGAAVDLSNATSAVDPATGGGNGRGFNVTAYGSGTIINLAKLATLTDLTPGNTSLSAQAGGTVSIPLVTQLDNVTVTVADPASVIPLAQVTSLTRSTLTAQSGATVTATGLTSLTGPLTLQATGGTASLNLSGVTKLATDTVDFSSIAVTANGSGTVNLSNATSALDPAAGSSNGRGFTFNASGTGCLINLAKLASFVDQSPGGTSLSAYGGGEVRIPLVTALDGVTVVLDTEASVIPVAQLATLSRSSVTVTNTTTPRAFTTLTNFNGSTLYGNSTTVTFPALAGYDNLGNSTYLQVFNGGLTLPTLATVTLTTNQTTFGVPALTLKQLSVTNNAAFVGAASTTVAKSLTWTQGYIDGPGVVRLLAGGTGTINGTIYKQLSRTLENAGALTYSGSSLYLNASTPGVVANLAGGTLTLSGDGDILPIGGSGQSVTNAGTLVRTGSGTTTVGVPFSSTGSVDVKAGRLELTGSLAFNGSATFKSAAASTVTVDGPITGSTTASAGYAPLGTTVVSGGTAGSPRLFEAMGKDVGATIAGLQNNFALGTLQLNGAYVKLTDAADNAAGAGAEAVYLDRVDVPSGSTLDLNGLHLYAHVRTGTGTIVNGTVGLLVTNVKGVTFNGAQVQRSNLTTAEVTFTTTVTASAGAFTVTRQSNGTTVPFTLSTAVVDGRTVATLNFGTAGLTDGYYGLKVTANLVTDGQSNKLDGDADNVPGGDFTYAGTDFFRYLGDFDGDGAVDGNDLAVLATAFNSVTGDANYRAFIDLDGDGAVDGNDLAVFAQRFNTVL